MTPHETAQNLSIIKQMELDIISSASTQVHKIADALITIDPSSASSPYPSSNNNGVYYFGCNQNVTHAHFTEILTIFKTSNIEKFFFWLSPNPQEKEITTWLQDSGFNPFGGTKYPTLTRPVKKVSPHKTHLTVKHISKTEAENHKQAIIHIFGAWPCDFFFNSCEHPNFHHFLAYENETPVSAAILVTHNQFAHLGWAATAEQHQGKGGQNALIKTRLNHAQKLGCQMASSETLTALQTSLGNLKRNQFQEIYEKQVFVYQKQT